MATNRAIEPEFAQRLPTLGERIDPLECLAVLRAQCAVVEVLHAALQALDVAIPAEMPVQVRRLARLAEAVPPSMSTVFFDTFLPVLANWRSFGKDILFAP